MTTRLERILTALPADRGCRTVAELTAVVGTSARRLSPKIYALVRLGLVETLRRDCYRLTERGVIARDAGLPRQAPKRVRISPYASIIERVWSALRKAKKGTVAELLELAQREGDRHPRKQAERYLRTLERAGLVTRLKGRYPSVWLLPRDPGALAPRVVGHGGFVYERNADRFIDIGGDR